LVSQRRVTPRYRNALIVSAMVCGIAAYHYFRIFDNLKESYPPGATTDAPHILSGFQFNEAYRYVDWFLTVPLLLIATVAVLALVGLWGVYPIAYMFPLFGGDFFGGAGGFVLRQGGYSIADILAKAAYGLAIYKIARVKSALEDPAYRFDEGDADETVPAPAM